MKRIKLTRRKLIVAAICVIILFLLIFSVNVYSGYMEYLEIGSNFVRTFWTNLSIKVFTSCAVFICSFIVVFINMMFIRNNILATGENIKYIRRIFPLVLGSGMLAFIVSLIVGDTISENILPYINSQWFGRGDPIFYQDVGYYVFQRPLIVAILNGLVSLTVFTLIFNVLAYCIMYVSLDIYKFRRIFKQKAIVFHIVVNIAFFFLLKVISSKFQAETMLFENQGSFWGAGFTDIRVWRIYYAVIPYILAMVIAIMIFSTLRNYKRILNVSLFVYPFVWVLALLIGSLTQSLYVVPNRMIAEEPYITHNINYTRSAYGINNVINQSYSVDELLKGQDIVNNMNIISNVRLTDSAQTIKWLNKTQNNRSFYTFADTDVASYNVEGRKTSVLVSARELNSDTLIDSDRSYNNLHMRYTHGIGIVVAPVSAVTENGEPYLVVKDVPTRSFDGMPNISEPRIYFGEKTDEYAIVLTKDYEYDELEGNYSYQGSAGIQLNFLNRLIYAFKYADPSILVSNQIQNESKLLTNRNVIKRVEKVAPFLKVDTDPMLTIDGSGKLKWIVDAYTMTSYYPYSKTVDGHNYIRNSVKIVVDAYDGTVKFYIIDDSDPIVQSFAVSYPSFFEQSDFPTDIATQIRYPEYLFKQQVSMLNQYHVTNPQEFYQQQGMWAIAREKHDEDKLRDVSPNYGILDLGIDGTKEELVLSIPLTYSQKDNMSALAMARCELANYGELVIYDLQSANSVPGPTQIDNMIDDNTAITGELSLWNSGKSSVIRGSMIVLPLKNSVLYIKPIYVSEGTTSTYGLKRVIVAYKDELVMAPTLDEALNSMFDVNISNVYENETVNEAIERVVKTFELYKSFSKTGDWEEMGNALKLLDEAVNALNGYNQDLLENLQNNEENLH